MTNLILVEDVDQPNQLADNVVLIVNKHVESTSFPGAPQMFKFKMDAALFAFKS